VWLLLLGFFMFFSAFSPWFWLVLDAWEAWEGRLGVVVKDLRTIRVIHGVMFLRVLVPAHPGCRR